jgi:rhodanese-related sulfurtransferase
MIICRRLKWSVLKFLIRLKFPSVRHISTAELAAWLEDCQRKPPLLLDARTPQEYAVSHLQQAHLSPSDLQELIDSTGLSRSTPIVTYCSVGYRSAILAQRLQEKGYEQVFNLEGSLFAWFSENRLVYPWQQIRQIHPYNQFWSLWLE